MSRLGFRCFGVQTAQSLSLPTRDYQNIDVGRAVSVNCEAHASGDCEAQSRVLSRRRLAESHVYHTHSSSQLSSESVAEAEAEAPLHTWHGANERANLQRPLTASCPGAPPDPTQTHAFLTGGRRVCFAWRWRSEGVSHHFIGHRVINTSTNTNVLVRFLVTYNV